jgi:ABC-type branched-subunit amino acid transport system substrate-binding protein
MRGRRDKHLLLISPTATEIEQPNENAFTLWSRDRRHTDVARDLARFLGGDAGLQRLGVLYPIGPLGQISYESFEEAARETGAAVVAASAYRPDTATFQDPIGRLTVGMPQAIFVDADALPTVLQLTPQIPYYGIEGSIIAGSALWGAPEVLRQLEGTLGNAWIVGAYIDRSAEASPWTTFKDLYEIHYRKSLRDNMLPALGYDAMRVILSAIASSGTADPARVSRAARELEIAGATGLFRLDAGTSTVVRTTLIRALRDGALSPFDVASLLAWRDAEAEEAARRAAQEKENEG